MRRASATVRPEPTLAGRRILVVEDEYFIADDLAQAIRALGGEVIGPVGDAPAAVAALDAEDHIDAAILDINLHNEMVYPIAAALRGRAIPFAFSTGYDKQIIPTEFADVEHYEKPLDPKTIAQNLAHIVGG